MRKEQRHVDKKVNVVPYMFDRPQTVSFQPSHVQLGNGTCCFKDVTFSVDRQVLLLTWSLSRLLSHHIAVSKVDLARPHRNPSPVWSSMV